MCRRPCRPCVDPLELLAVSKLAGRYPDRRQVLRRWAASHPEWCEEASSGPPVHSDNLIAKVSLVLGPVVGVPEVLAATVALRTQAGQLRRALGAARKLFVSHGTTVPFYQLR